MDVEIVSIGDEILEGLTVNSNAAFLSQILTEKGYRISRHTALPDEKSAIQKGLREAMNRSSLVIATGGLGPTLHDLTREAASPLLHQPIELKNRLGSALGIFQTRLVLLPGVPKEMEVMFSEEALPLIEKHYPVENRVFSRRFTLALLREVEVDPFLRTLQTPGLEIAIYPSYGSLQIVFRGLHPVDEYVQKIQKEFPTFFVGEGKVEEAIHRELIERKKTLAFAESCTGGSLAARLTALPDASLFFAGSIVAYSNRWKERFLGVRRDTLSHHGAVSPECVKEMVQGLIEETECDYAVATSGTLGPKGGTSKKPVGTVYLAIAKRGEKIDVGRLNAPQERKAGTEFTIQTALGALWRRIVHSTATFS